MHGPEEPVARQAVELCRVVAKRVQVPHGPAVFRQTQRLDAGNLFQAGRQIVGILAPPLGLLHQLVELRQQD